MELWNELIEFSTQINDLFDENFFPLDIGEEFPFNGWTDNFWHSYHIRKCHLKTIDNRNTQKVWLMHMNIFPETFTDIPILGFDIVAGPNKITGSFFDMSPVTDNNEMVNYFCSQTQKISWNKPRELPEWAQAIFSKGMIAAGNIRDKEELDQLKEVTFDLIKYYIENLDNFKIADKNIIKEKHNSYCRNQKLNPHLHRSILSMGISEKDKNRYVNKALFEEI